MPDTDTYVAIINKWSKELKRILKLFQKKYYSMNIVLLTRKELKIAGLLKMTIKIIIWMLILAYFHAKQETEIEGKAGWARHLPTFRINIFLTKLLLGKEITGYHIYMLLMFLVMFHLPYLFIPFTIKTELTIIGCMSFIGY